MSSTPTTPVPVELDATDAARIQQLVAREQALGKMTADFQKQYEQRATALQNDMGVFWRGVAEKYGLDMQNVMYAPSIDYKTILPIQMRFATPSAPSAIAG